MSYSSQSVILEKALRSLFFLQQVLSGNCLQDVLFARFLDVATQQQFIQHEISLFKIENNIEFADGAKVFIEQLDVAMDDFQREEFVIGVFNGAAKIQRRISFVDDLEILPLQKRAHLRFARQDGGNEFSRDFFLHFILMRHVPFLQSQLALSAEEKHELNHGDGGVFVLFISVFV